jgi:hypothetical protein
MTRLAASLVIALLVAMVSACDRAQSSPGLADEAGIGSALPGTGRTACPGSVPAVLDRVDGLAADELEMLQGRFEGMPGFLGVVNDGHGSVIVVDVAMLLGWQQRMSGSGVSVARSCIDPSLLRTVKASLGVIKPRQGGIVAAGYDALKDTITVTGTTREELLRSIDLVAPGTGDNALASMSDGTLRVIP